MALLTFGDNLAKDQNGQPLAFAKRYVFNAGTDELSVLFREAHLTELTENPASADQNGVFQNCYLHEGQYRVVIVTARGKVASKTENVLVSENERGFVRRFSTVSELLADTRLSYSAQRAKLRVAEGQILDVADGNFTYHVTAENDPSPDLVTAGGVRLCVLCAAEPVNVMAFGAMGDGVTDDTAALQRAINAASKSNAYEVHVPDGHYIYDTLCVFYDPVLNPGFRQETNPDRQGRLRLVGQGALAVAELRNYAPKYGSVLEATGDGIVVASGTLGHGGSPYPSRKFEAEGITFVGSKADAYVIEAAACPLFSLRNCVVYQRNADGHGVYVKSAWYADFERTRFFGVSGSQGTAISAGSATFGGLYTLRNCQVDTWRDGLDWQDGSFSNVSVKDTSFQSCTRNGIRGSGGSLHHCHLSNVYFEGVSREVDIKGIGATIKHLKIDQMFVLGGANDGTSFITDSVIDLDETTSIDISGVYANRLTKTFCNVTEVSNFGVSSGNVCHFSVTDDVGYAGPAIALFTGVLPSFGEGIVWPGYQLGYNDASSLIRLFDPTDSYPNVLTDRRTGTTSISSLALGEVAEFPGQNSVLVISPTEKRTLIEVGVSTGAGVSVRLPNQSYVMNGRLFMVRSATDSTGLLVVRNNSDNSKVLSLQPGQSCIVSFDANAGKYVRFMAVDVTPQGDVTSLTDSTGGVDGAVLGAVSSSGADTQINDNFATVAAQIDTILSRMRDAGLLV